MLSSRFCSIGRCLGLLLALGRVTPADDAPRVLSAERIRLGTPGAPEWEEFANDPPRAGAFHLRFEAEPNLAEATLLIRQTDVKQEWRVELNHERLGKLFLMEADLVHTLGVPPGLLRSGENVLSILPPLENDDIVVTEVVLDPRVPQEAVGAATLALSVTDQQSGRSLPCRLTIVDERGSLAPLVAAKDSPALAIRPGVVYAGTGHARVGLRPGRYTILASRGFEYGSDTQKLEILAGQTREVVLKIAREVATPGWVSCDTHIHTLTHSGHGDATLDERILTLAGEGIELPIATEHNFYADYTGAAHRLGVTEWFTPVTGNEVTTPKGHFNIFPVNPGAPVVDFNLADWPPLMAAIRTTPGVRVVVLNHPRGLHSGFRPFDPANFNAATGDNKRGAEFTFDALEVLNSGAQQSDYLLVYRDWFALLNHGYRITAVGASDSHDVSRFIVGQARTYLPVDDADPARIDVAAACKSLLEGRALVSMGLLAQLKVEGRFGVGDLATGLPAQMRVEVRVLGPSWVEATHVDLYANGVRIREEEVAGAGPSPSAPGPAGEKGCVVWSVPRPAHDVHLVAIATGPALSAPFWAMTRPYQPASTHWLGRAIASTNPIWIDGDNDQQFTAARGYARRLVELHGTAPLRLIPALAEFDETVAAQAASLCAAAGEKLDGAPFSAALKSAPSQVAAGFARYRAAGSTP